MAVLLAGCAGGGSLSGSGGDAGSLATSEVAREKLERLAAREQSRSPRRPAAVAPPPGLEPQVLLPAEDPRARLPLTEALGEVVSLEADAFAPAETDEAAPDSETIDQALRHYAKGRDAALQSRYLTAVFELEKAAALDPTSPAILRLLARCYLARPNALKAASLYERLLRVDPDDSEALFTLGLAATNRRDFERAAAYLGRPRLHESSFDHDPAAGFLADFMLASSLRNLGYDRASVELSRSLLEGLPDRLEAPSFHVKRFERLYRLRPEIWQAVGDAHCRLEQYERALEAYGRSDSELIDFDLAFSQSGELSTPIARRRT